MANHPDDGKYVVVQNGQRATGNLHETEEAAQAEADKLKKPLQEQKGQAQAQPTVKKNLYD